MACRAAMTVFGDANAALLVPFVAAPMLACMADSDASVRAAAAPCFANIVRLMPLDATRDTDALATRCLSAHMQTARNTHRTFCAQLLDGSKLPRFALPPNVVNATLRAYQQDGVNWLAFLRRYGVHGVLCDEMGLGKTLQTLAIVAADRAEHEHVLRQRAAAQAVDHPTSAAAAAATASASAPLFESSAPPSIVVCPPTLRRHWQVIIENPRLPNNCISLINLLRTC